MITLFLEIKIWSSSSAITHLGGRGVPKAAGSHSHFSPAARLEAASRDAEAVRREQSVWERKVGELQARCTTLEEEKYEALAKVRESVQVAEEAALQKDQVSLPSFLPILFPSFHTSSHIPSPCAN